jgi:hypothetical protein
LIASMTPLSLRSARTPIPRSPQRIRRRPKIETAAPAA